MSDNPRGLFAENSGHNLSPTYYVDFPTLTAPDGTFMLIGSRGYFTWRERWSDMAEYRSLVYPGGSTSAVYDPGRDTVTCIGSRWTGEYEFDGGRWRSQGKLGMNVQTALFDPASRNIVAIAERGEPVLLRTLSWDGKRWKDMAKAEPNPLCRGFLVCNTEKSEIYYFANTGDQWEIHAKVMIWQLAGGEWQQVYREHTEAAPFHYFHGVAWDQASRHYVLSTRDLDNRLSVYAFDASGFQLLKKKSNAGFLWPEFNSTSASGELPWALTGKSRVINYDYFLTDVHIVEWNGRGWKRGPMLFNGHLTGAQWLTCQDEIRGEKLFLSDDLNSILAYGPFTGPRTSRLAAKAGYQSALTLFDRGTRSWSGAKTGVLKGAGVLPFVGRFTKWGSAESGMFAPLTGRWYFEGGERIGNFGRLGDLPVVGDYDGDGRDEIAVFRPATGEWLSPNRVIATVGGAGMTPVPADYDGDGKTDPAVYDARTGIWRFASRKKVTLGNEDSWPLPADYDGDGKADIAVWNRQTGVWKTPTKTLLTFGVVSDVPVPIDTDGDGRAEPTHYRPGTGEWFVNGVWRADREKYRTVVW